MKYVNEQGEEFSIRIEDSKWTVRFAPAWKVYGTFHVTSDERAREVFWVLSRLKNCRGCRRHLSSSEELCEPCRALKLSREPPTEPIQQCSVCYQELFEVLDNKVHLKCKHPVCKVCCSRLCQPSGDITWDFVAGIMHLGNVKCPMCREVSVVETKTYRVLPSPFNLTV